MAECIQCGGRANKRHSCAWCGKQPMCLQCHCECRTIHPPPPDASLARKGAHAIAAILENGVREHLAPTLAFLAKANERAALVSFGSSTDRWLVVMVTRELVDHLAKDVEQLQQDLRAAAEKGGVPSLDVTRRGKVIEVRDQPGEEPATQPVPHPIHGFATAAPTLKKAQELVGGPVQMLTLPNGDQLLVHEEGRYIHTVNAEASLQWPHWGPLFGPVVHLQGKARWK